MRREPGWQEFEAFHRKQKVDTRLKAQPAGEPDLQAPRAEERAGRTGEAIPSDAPVAAKITILGSGTSMGVPTLGCRCRTCTSEDPRDNRMRPSIAISWGTPDACGEPAHRVVIDTGQEFRVQALRSGIHHLDAVFYTHAHADHTLGLDDLRPLSFIHQARHHQPLPLYADDGTASVLERVFDYTFSKNSSYPTRARVALHRIAADQSTPIAGLCFRRIPILHGGLPIAGYRFGNAAYLTDMSDIPAASMALLEGLDVLILDALRIEPHPSHANVDQALRWVERLEPRRAFFTHMSHELRHADTELTLPGHVRLAYDCLEIPFSFRPCSPDHTADTRSEGVVAQRAPEHSDLPEDGPSPRKSEPR